MPPTARRVKNKSDGYTPPLLRTVQAMAMARRIRVIEERSMGDNCGAANRLVFLKLKVDEIDVPEYAEENHTVSACPITALPKGIGRPDFRDAGRIGEAPIHHEHAENEKSQEWGVRSRNTANREQGRIEPAERKNMSENIKRVVYVSGAKENPSQDH